MKCYRLRVSGITEQRKSGAWKMVELVCVSVTPIFISIMGDFGDDFRQPIQLLAITLSLVSTICQLSPVGRGEALLSFSSKLETLCWTYWSVTGEFEEMRQERTQRELEKEAAKSEKAQGFWTLMHKRLREDRANILQRVKQQQEHERDRDGGDGGGGGDGGDRGDGQGVVQSSRRLQFDKTQTQEVDSYLDSSLTPLECARVLLFPNFVALVTQAIQEGEAELQKSFAAPRLVTSHAKKSVRKSTFQDERPDPDRR